MLNFHTGKAPETWNHVYGQRTISFTTLEIRGRILKRSLAYANENRDWRIYADFAQVLIISARQLYADDDFGLELEETLYALDASKIDFIVPALVIAELYRCRWQVELFLKWIKQHLRIKAFSGTSENAAKIHIWIAVSGSVLVAIEKSN